jgi:hypothetical protein
MECGCLSEVRSAGLLWMNVNCRRVRVGNLLLVVINTARPEDYKIFVEEVGKSSLHDPGSSHPPLHAINWRARMIVSR